MNQINLINNLNKHKSCYVYQVKKLIVYLNCAFGYKPVVFLYLKILFIGYWLYSYKNFIM